METCTTIPANGKSVGLFIIASLSFLSLSCSQHGANPIASQQQQFNNPYAYVGQEHNEGLSYIFQQIKRGGLSVGSVTSEGNLLSEVQGFGIRFLQGKGQGELSITQFLSASETPFRSNKFTVSSDSTETLSGGQREYIDEIYALIDSDSIQDTTQFFLSLNIIEEQAYNRLGPDSSAIVLVVGSVAHSSASYWVNNYQDWEIALSAANGNKRIDVVDSVKVPIEPGSGNGSGIGSAIGPIVGADAQGAIAGAIGAAATGCAELTLGGCAALGAAGGALGMSAGQAVSQIWLYYFPNEQ